MPFLLFLGYNAHFAPSVCMSAFSIKVQQHNEEAEMNMSVAKSFFCFFLRPKCSECLLIPAIFCTELENRRVS